MFYLGIDQHARQLTISLRNEHGDVVQARQVSTQPEKMQEFFERLKREFLREGEPFLAVVEVCGFNDWLLQALEDHHCHKVILIQPEERKRQKTDRRDAAALSELLWVNRDRFLAGKPVHGLRQVQLPSATDQQNRRLNTLRKEASEARTRVINKIKHLLRRHKQRQPERIQSQNTKPKSPPAGTRTAPASNNITDTDSQCAHADHDQCAMTPPEINAA